MAIVLKLPTIEGTDYKMLSNNWGCALKVYPVVFNKSHFKDFHFWGVNILYSSMWIDTA